MRLFATQYNIWVVKYLVIQISYVISSVEHVRQ